MNFKQLLHNSFEIVCASAHPDNSVKDYIPKTPEKGRLIVIGAGKASASMAAAFEENYHSDISGIVVTRYGHKVPTSKIQIIEAAHPIPDDACVDAVEQILALLETAGPDDTVICLMSGGGSSLLTAPVDDIEFPALQDLNKKLLTSGASIHEINTVRKHVNKALGGGLAQYCAAGEMMTLAISDVTGDDPAIIASGATVADPSTLADALSVLEKYEIILDQSIIAALNNDANETLKPGHATFKNHSYHLISTPKKSINAAAEFWQKNGFHPHILDVEMEGDTNICAKNHVDFIHKIYSGEIDLPLPCALLSGGETTVRVTGSGQGGPNTQFMLQSAIALYGHEKIYGMSCDTDGIDGSADNAGAIITPETISNAKDINLSSEDYLQNNDSYNFFKDINGLVKTGPTYTNVNDYRVFLLLP